ncbi:efflux transporter, putative, hydrophobe/amphiphile efflux-3 (HAE3) family [Luteitalea pratensis]|uniref:Efflux transporter, putative, hydrophobe/amphiphile efflux-3 (HAE3) family n=2 Tax=Luteitalea pratensis TaxID=1855912 RepID=A0A143PVW0_LUTPR|nr:efflux transporter, putative, hydrophobe/amphiphile efflux-3 (HAE3) family [Luteitalea pratensis]
MTGARARRGLVLVLAAALTIASLVPVLRIRFGTDVLQLMPRESGAVDAFETYLERFGSLDTLYVFVEAPSDGAIADYRDYVDALADGFRALPDVTRVDTGRLDASRDWAYLTDRQLLLLDDAGFAEALARMTPERVPAQVARTRELLALPAPGVKAMAQRDPLGWFELTSARLQGAAGVLRIDPSSTDGYVTPDGRAQLLVVHPTQPPFDTAYARLLIADVAGAEARVRAKFAPQWADEDLSPPRTDVAGGHRTAIETESLMRGEAASNTLWSMVGVLALLYLAFRNAWLVLFGTLPILLGTLVTLALHQVAGVQLSAAATGASAMLFGLGDDGLVLLFVAYRDRLARGLSPIDAVRDLGGIGVSVLLGAVTTAATFLGLSFMSFPSLQQLGIVVGVGMLLTVFFTLTVLVAGLPGRAWVERSRDLSMPGLGPWVDRHRREILALAIAISLPLGWGLTKLHVDPRVERLRPVTAGLALETEITERFGLARDVYLVLSRGAALEPLLEAHEALDGRLGTTEGLAHVGPTVVLPSQTVQAARRSQLVATPDERAVADAVDAAGDAQGFVAGTFTPFRERLGRVLDPAQALTLDGLQGHGLGDIVGRFVRRDGPDYLVATYATAATPAALSALHTAIAPDARLTLTGLPMVNAALGARFPRELAAGIGAGALVVLFLIWLEFRKVGPTLLALIPTICGIIWGLGALGWAGVVLDLFSVFAILMFLGIGVDYGIHLLHPTLDGHAGISETLSLVGPALLLAGGTTIVGFGALVWSAYGPLHSLGLVSVATITSALLASVLVLPAVVLARGRTP